MGRKLFLFFWILMLTIAAVKGQMVIKDVQQLNELKKVPLEKMFVHHGNSLLFPGEYLVYTVYCINAYTFELSDFSKIAYIELVSEKGDLIFSHKLRLQKGRGQGDFFIPVELSSGNYKLLGYTQWMKNGGLKQIFQDDIVIINPYQSNQEALRSKISDLNNPTGVPSIENSEGLKSTLAGNDVILPLTDQKLYGKRAKVSLVPKNYKGALGYGNYSILVRKKESIPHPNSYSANGYSQETIEIDKFIPQSVNDSIYLPEQTGELFWGNVSESASGVPGSNKTVIVSIPGEDFQLKYATTDAKGNFYTYLNKAYDANMAIVQVLDANDMEFNIRIKEQSPLDYNHLKFNSYSITPELEKAILARSIQNQVENAYFTLKPDTILSVKDTDPFIGGNPEIYKLDDYTRFPTLKETLVEVVDNVWFKKVNGRETIWVRQYLEPSGKDDEYVNLPPIVLIDGVFIPDHEDILNFNALTIKEIKTVRDQFVLGRNKYLGMVAVETIDGDYPELWRSKTNGIKKELFKPLLKKNYFVQNYSQEQEKAKERIPDFRNQLLWVPNLIIDEKDKSFEFYTSDILGEYEIVLEGFTTYGKPISVIETFFVK